ncbi:S-layer homology domain-containing protein [Lysinibacillus telephonicus]|uniref:S-layer homology domain-containing protein n=1 Tax=Lysinibacillus telephonicus TaxID=1714840 RepID=UPI0037D30D72
MKSNKLLLSALSLAVVTPAVAIPMSEVEAETYNKTFKDVSKQNVYYDIIHIMAQQGIISGYEDGTFKPSQTINRKQAAALVNRAVKLPKTTAFKTPKDLSTKNAYYTDIKALMEAGLLTVDSKGNVNPNSPLTRGEMAKILTVAFNLKTTGTNPLKDVSSTYKPYVTALYNAGVTTGFEDNTFRENASLTRAHYAVFMYRAMNPETIKNTEPIDPSKIDVNKITAKEFNEMIKGNPYFATTDGVPATEQSFGNKDFVKVLVNLEKEFKTEFPKQKVVTIAGAIILHDYSYSSELTERGLYHGGQIEIWYGGDNGLGFTFDQTDETAVKAVRKALEIAYNNTEIINLFNERLAYVNDHYKKYPNKPQEPLTQAYTNIEGFEYVRLGTSDYRGFKIDIKRE